MKRINKDSLTFGILILLLSPVVAWTASPVFATGQDVKPTSLNIQKDSQQTLFSYQGVQKQVSAKSSNGQSVFTLYQPHNAYHDNDGVLHGARMDVAYSQDYKSSAYSLVNSFSDSERHVRLGLNYGAISLGYVTGQSDTWSELHQSASGFRSNFFHGLASQSFSYDGTSLVFGLTRNFSLFSANAKVQSPGMENRYGRALGFDWKGISGTAMQFHRGDSVVGSGLEVGFAKKNIRFGAQYRSSELGAKLFRLSWQQKRKSGAQIQLDLESGSNPHFEDVSENRLVFSFKKNLRQRGIILHADSTEEVEVEEEGSRSRKGLAIGIVSVVAVGAMASSSGDEEADNSLRFGQQHDAGYDALFKINPTSVAENREYGGIIYRYPDGSYSYTGPIQGETASVNIGGPTSVPGGTSATASYHTHGGNDPRYINEEFSNQDIRLSDFYGWDAYLGTPGGAFKFYDYDIRKISTLGTLPTQ